MPPPSPTIASASSRREEPPPHRDWGHRQELASTPIRLYHSRMVARLSQLTGESLRSFGDLFAAMQSMADPLEAFGGDTHAGGHADAHRQRHPPDDFRADDGLDEIRLPALQPGSSIMPGKVNPVMAEMLNMVAFHVIGSDLAVALAAQAGQLELNVMMPLIAYELLYSQSYLARGVQLLPTGPCADRRQRGKVPELDGVEVSGWRRR